MSHSFVPDKALQHSFLYILNLCYICALLFVRRFDEDHLVILGSGLVGTQMTCQANPRSERSLAVWAGNGGGIWGPVGSVLPDLPALLSC